MLSARRLGSEKEPVPPVYEERLSAGRSRGLALALPGARLALLLVRLRKRGVLQRLPFRDPLTLLHRRMRAMHPLNCILTVCLA